MGNRSRRPRHLFRPAASLRNRGVWSVVWTGLLVPPAVASGDAPKVFLVLVGVAVVFVIPALPGLIITVRRIGAIAVAGKAIELRQDPLHAAALWLVSGRAFFGRCRSRQARVVAALTVILLLALVGWANSNSIRSSGRLSAWGLLSLLLSVIALELTLLGVATALMFRRWERRCLLAIMTWQRGNPRSLRRRSTVVVDRPYVNSWKEARAALNRAPGPRREPRRARRAPPDPLLDDFGPYLAGNDDD